jgi:peptidoglycan/LPS O-acetylase OafA/YrhL
MQRVTGDRRTKTGDEIVVKRQLARQDAGEVGEIPALDGVRGLAILLVVCCHIGTQLWRVGLKLPSPLPVSVGFAYIGVDLFFVLSGFLLFLPYGTAIVSPIGTRSWPATGRFYLRRIRRIFPVYLVVVAVPVVVLISSVVSSGSVVLISSIVSSGSRQGLISLAGLLTLLYDWNGSTYFIPTAWDGSLWSLTIEWQFYLILPLLALGLAWLAKRQPKRLAIGLGIVTAFGLSTRVLATVVHYTVAAQPTDLPGLTGPAFGILYGMNGKRLEDFAAGMLVSVVFVAARERRRLPWSLPRWTAPALISLMCWGLGICLVWASGAGRLSDDASFQYPRQAAAWSWGVFGDWAVCVCFAGLLLTVLFAPLVARVFEVWPLRFMGRISYSVYLWHWPIVIYLLTAPSLLTVPSLTRLVLVLGLILALGIASYYGIERPFLRMGRRTVTRLASQPLADAPAPASATASDPQPVSVPHLAPAAVPRLQD